MQQAAQGAVMPSQDVAVGKGHGVNYLSLLSVVATIAVLYLHTNTCFWSFSTEPYWLAADVIESVCYFAVPIFFMMSGATLIGYRARYSTKEFFKKRFVKTVIPFLVWSVVAFIFCGYLDHTYDASNMTPLKFYNDLVDTKFLNIYWFFRELFVVYLCIPLFAAVPEELRKSVFGYVAVACFVCNLAMPFAIGLTGEQISWPFFLTIAAGYLFYPVVGYLLHHYDLTRPQAGIVYVLGIAGLAAHIVGTYVLSMDQGEIVSTFKGYNNVPCILYSVAIFVFVKRHHGVLRSQRLSKVVGFLSGHTFAVYLMHWYILRLTVHFLALNTVSLAYRLVMPWWLLIACVAISWVVKKIPGLRAILP